MTLWESHKERRREPVVSTLPPYSESNDLYALMGLMWAAIAADVNTFAVRQRRNAALKATAAWPFADYAYRQSYAASISLT